MTGKHKESNASFSVSHVSVCGRIGKPVIATAVQGETTTKFLILTATIQTNGDKQ